MPTESDFDAQPAYSMSDCSVAGNALMPMALQPARYELTAVLYASRVPALSPWTNR